MSRASQASFQRLLAASRELRQRLTDLRRTLSGCDDGRQVAALLDDVHERLTARFRHEEEGGYLGEVVAVAPGRLGEATRLRRQHGELLADLARLEEMAERCRDPSQWNELRAAAALFRSELERHERAETELVQETLTTDLGAQD